jgi:hypothetical protein
MLSYLKLYIIIISLNNTIKMVTSILFTIVISVLYIKYQIVYADDTKFIAVHDEYNYYKAPRVIIQKESGEEFQIILSGNYHPIHGFEMVQLTKSEQMHSHLTGYITNEEYKKIAEDDRELYLKSIARKRKPIPDVETTHQPLPPKIVPIEIPQLLTDFNYKKFFFEFKIIIKSCTTERESTEQMIRFLNNNLPKELISQSKTDISNDNAPINKFVTYLINKVELKSEEDVILLANCQAAVCTYNVSILNKCLNNIEIIQKTYFSMYEVCAKQMLSS